MLVRRFERPVSIRGSAGASEESIAMHILECPSCRFQFVAVADAGGCPQCGVQVTSPRSLAETLLFDEASAADETDREQAGDVQRSQSERLAQLVGSDLDVYHIDSLLGRGGMGCVFRAIHRDLHRPCALKILLPSLAEEDAHYVARFQNEGRAAAGLVHPNVVTIYAIGEATGYHFLEMEFLPGRSLQQVIKAEGRLTPVRATSLASRMAEGLGAAHQAEIVHQDLKPDNVLLTHQGIPKIADFGLAKRIRPRPDSELPDCLCGTPNFMAPEIFQGSPATPTSDVYALGVTYYLMLTGEFPFAAPTIPKLMQMVTSQSAPSVRSRVPELPLEMAECLASMLDKTPSNRPKDGTVAAQLLNAVLGHVRNIESLLNNAFSGGKPVRWTRSGERYRVDISLPKGRNQVVFIEPSTHGAAERLLVISSVCCNAVPAYFEHALRLNAEMLHGSLALREIEGVQKFVVIDTYPRSTVDAEEVRRSVLEVAYRADAVEQLLTGLDRH
jgi:serine/threonine-protein kinase